MKINQEKLKDVVIRLYVREVLGKSLYTELYLHPQLIEVTNELTNAAMQFELCVLNKKPYSNEKEHVKQLILSIHNRVKNIEKYRQSLLYFDENGNFVDLF